MLACDVLWTVLLWDPPSFLRLFTSCCPLINTVLSLLLRLKSPCVWPPSKPISAVTADIFTATELHLRNYLMDTSVQVIAIIPWIRPLFPPFSRMLFFRYVHVWYWHMTSIWTWIWHCCYSMGVKTDSFRIHPFLLIFVPLIFRILWNLCQGIYHCFNSSIFVTSLVDSLS